MPVHVSRSCAWRALGAAVAAVALATVTACAQPVAPASPDGPASGNRAGDDSRAELRPATPQPAELPRGGREVFPRYRLVGFSGGPGTEAFGRLGVGDLDERVAEAEQAAAPYAAGREVLPVLELVTVVAHSVPGPDGLYRGRVSDEVIGQYLEAARRHRALLLLNVQPGRADFLAEVQALEKWLVQPDVGLALDPEWAVGPDGVPGEVYGSTTGAELDAVSAHLDQLVSAHDLPQKVMVFHQVAPSVVTGQEALQARPGVVVVKSVDGIGSVESKTETWNRLVAGLPPQIRPGFKLFFSEDARHGPLMTPEQVLALVPQPEYVLYE